MSIDSIRLAATYETVEWVEDQDGPCEDPLIETGWCDPRNPWGTVSYGDQDPTYLVLPVMEAARFVVNFPGGVWNWSESPSEQNYRTGVWTSVTLHVMDHEDTVLALADGWNNCADVYRHADAGEHLTDGVYAR